MAAVQTRQALTSTSVGNLELNIQSRIPNLRPGTLLCRVEAVGLNPADFKSSDHATSPGSVGGFDFAGVVLEVGTGVTRFSVGDRVAGAAYGYNPDDKELGAFTNVVLAAEELTLKLPPSWTFEQGATLGVVVTTAGFGLNHYLQVPIPGEEATQTGGRDQFVLVSGGGTASGMVAIQWLHLAGFKPLASCSPSSMDLVRSLGAVATFDYRAPTCGADIRRFTEGRLAHVLDCAPSVEGTESMRMCYAAIGPKGGRYVALNPISTLVKYTRRDVSADWLMAVAMFGETVSLPGVYGRPARPELRTLAARIFRTAEMLISQGLLTEPRFQIRAGGLGAVGQGVEELRRGLTGGKLVFPLT
ncbi:Enoyl reductase LovC [Diaporthe amygdali]|uniref:Enoyl reductase LovC n=1 Tax=Phomopsis amygdali TaxID=1214568 RepID=UPI0022FDBADD|nr:Enoyl reductase LovC [Diaporthe amygdali]KAJ0124366.1 Enoyl reductase LovC [Diaporthe amygdali]